MQNVGCLGIKCSNVVCDASDFDHRGGKVNVVTEILNWVVLVVVEIGNVAIMVLCAKPKYLSVKIFC